MTKLQEKIASLDAALTRTDWRTASNPHQLAQATVEDIMQSTYYLSDGGYSRLCSNLNNGRIFPDSISRREVKDGWKYCKELIYDVEDAIREQLKARGDGWPWMSGDNQ